jgi:thiamine-monophosphate kinase
LIGQSVEGGNTAMELEWIAWLRERVSRSTAIECGIGDDAAVVAVPPSSRLVVSTDLLLDGVHFRLSETTPARVGRKCLAVNLSDLAAMAARPLAAFVSLALPRDHGLELAQGLYAGLLPLADAFSIPIAGGDTNAWAQPLAVNVTVLGLVEPGRAWLRSGAKPGDWVLVTGSLGGSLLGHHFDFQPRVHEALLLAERYDIHAAMDISDGLALDLSRLASESRCGACLELDKIPISPAAHQLAQADGRTPLEHALGDGEDFELLLAVSPEEAARLLADQPLAVPLRKVGQIIPEPGLYQQIGSDLQPLAPLGYRHD